ncbi:MAG: pilin [bacterium]
MFKLNLKKTASLFLWGCLIIIISAPLVVKAADKELDLWGTIDSGDYKGKSTAEAFKGETGLAEKDPRQMIAQIINIALGFLGLIAVVLILIGGFKWMTAGGNEDQVGEAKKWMYSGVVGLLIILASYALANFVINRLIDVTGSETTSSSSL